MNKEERRKYIFAQLGSLPNAIQYVEVTKYIENLEQQCRKQKQIDELQQENKILKDNWEIIRQYCLDEQIPEESDEYNSYIEFSNSIYDNILNKMQEITGVSDDNKTTI